MNVDFKAKPFFLDESDIAWVQDCMKKMTVEEKVSHLFCILIKDKPVEEMAAEMDALDRCFSGEESKRKFQKASGQNRDSSAVRVQSRAGSGWDLQRRNFIRNADAGRGSRR